MPRTARACVVTRSRIGVLQCDTSRRRVRGAKKAQPLRSHPRRHDGWNHLAAVLAIDAEVSIQGEDTALGVALRQLPDTDALGARVTRIETNLGLGQADQAALVAAAKRLMERGQSEAQHEAEILGTFFHEPPPTNHVERP